ncbi:MAG TPA: hypothetical protein VNI54_04645 [Thermoanaerobaculia bacterium]|nr:hypothetical protein [Thermoanaerobaculia bacterium]
MVSRNHAPEDARRYALAVDEFIAAYKRREGKRWHDASGPNSVFMQLASDLREWVAAGQKEGGQVRHERSGLADTIALDSKEVIGKDYLSTALGRIRTRLRGLEVFDQQGFFCDSSAVWLQIIGPTHDDDKSVWFDATFTEPLDARSRRIGQRLPPAPLPALPLHFVGRTELVAEVGRRLTDAHRGLVGFHGDALIGKTATAIAVAEAIRDRFPDAYFVALDASRGGSSDALTLLRKVVGAGAIGAHDDVGELRRRFRAAMSGRRGVIIFDDVNRADAFIDLVPPVGFVFALTTHAKLPIPGVDWIEVPRLSAYASRELIERLGPHINDEDAIGSIAAYCEGNPAALSAAATFLTLNRWDSARSYVMDLRSMEWDLLASSVVADAPLKILCSQVYENLPEEAKSTYRRLGMFSGRFSHEAAGAVLGLSTQHDLAPLIRCGALQFDDASVTYRVPLMIRWHARSLLTASDREITAPAHAQHYARLAKRTLEGGEVACEELRWSSQDLWDALSFTGRKAEADHVLTMSYRDLCRVLLPGRLPRPFEDADVLNIEEILLHFAVTENSPALATAYATGWLLAGRRHGRADYLETALRLAPEDVEIEQHAFAALVDVARQQAPHSAKRVAEALVRAGQARSPSEISLRGLQEAAILYALLGSPTRAADALELLRHGFGKLQQRRSAAQRAVHVSIRAIVELARRQWNAALQTLRRAYRLGDRRDEAFDAQLSALAAIAHAARGNTSRATSLASDASGCYRRDAITGLAAAHAYIRMNEYKEAARALMIAFGPRRRMRDVHDELCQALAYYLHAQVMRIIDGDPAAATASAMSAEMLLRQHGSRFASFAKRLVVILRRRAQTGTNVDHTGRSQT